MRYTYSHHSLPHILVLRQACKCPHAQVRWLCRALTRRSASQRTTPCLPQQQRTRQKRSPTSSQTFTSTTTLRSVCWTTEMIKASALLVVDGKRTLTAAISIHVAPFIAALATAGEYSQRLAQLSPLCKPPWLRTSTTLRSRSDHSPSWSYIYTYISVWLVKTEILMHLCIVCLG